MSHSIRPALEQTRKDGPTLLLAKLIPCCSLTTAATPTTTTTAASLSTAAVAATDAAGPTSKGGALEGGQLPALAAG
jgi:hypothetical protein